MNPGLIVLIVAVPLTLAIGVWRLRVDGRFTRASRPAEVVPEETMAEKSVLSGTPWADELGRRATLVQFSSAFCAPCRTTRRVLGEVAEVVPDVAHVEIDAELHLALVRRLNILRTPTTIVLDGAGREITRAAGAPTKEQVVRALAMTS